MFPSEVYTLQDSITIEGQIMTSGELVVKSQYLCYMQLDTNWYWNQHPQQNFITVPTRTILPMPRAAAHGDRWWLAGGGREHLEGADELGTFGAGAGKVGGVPKIVMEFLYWRDTAGPPLRGGNVGSDKENGVSPGRLPGKGCKAASIIIFVLIQN